jgi:hypothetical protein
MQAVNMSHENEASLLESSFLLLSFDKFIINGTTQSTRHTKLDISQKYNKNQCRNEIKLEGANKVVLNSQNTNYTLIFVIENLEYVI